MRVVVWLTAAGLLLAPVHGQETDNPFRAEMRQAVDADGRISITVPKRWEDKELAEDQVLRVSAVGGGGHDIKLERRKGEADIDRMREAFLKHDSAALAGSTVQKLEKPFYGYRLDSAAQGRVILRAFASDGPDGLVLTIASRHASYDELYWERLAWVAASLKVGNASTVAATSDSEQTEGERRVHDKDGRFSVLAPPGWKTTEAADGEALVLAPGGRTGGAGIHFKHWGGDSSASLVLTKVAADWQRSYGGAVLERLPGEPPRLLVKGRQGDSVDYFIGFANGAEGYTLRLSVNEAGYERTRSIADAMAPSLVFLTGTWSEPRPPALDLDRLHRKALQLHGTAEHAAALDEVAREFDRFLANWNRLGFDFDRKAPVLHVVVCAAGDFAATTSLFGEPPAAYNRQNRLVVALPPPSEEAKLAQWRGAVDYAFAEALLHRDLKVAAPAWMRRGLASCLRGSGLSDGKPDGEVPALTGMLVQRAGAKLPEKFATVRAWTEGDYLRDDSSDKQAHAWGYVHFMLYGKGALPNAFKKWSRALLKATKTVPDFELGKYDRDAEDLQAYVAKRWSESAK